MAYNDVRYIDVARVGTIVHSDKAAMSMYNYIFSETIHRMG